MVGKWTRALGSTVFLHLKICFNNCVIRKRNWSPDSSQTARDNLNHQQFLVLAVPFSRDQGEGCLHYVPSCLSGLGRFRSKIYVNYCSTFLSFKITFLKKLSGVHLGYLQAGGGAWWHILDFARDLAECHGSLNSAENRVGNVDAGYMSIKVENIKRF